jgi:metal-responsive CopG/Arc/MetJ family transcriptional regulator
MPKKVIQVPVDEGLLSSLDSMAKERGQSRSELIREACQRYLKQVEYEKMDKVYIEGYRRLPEEPIIGEAQVAAAGHVVSEETW